MFRTLKYDISHKIKIFHKNQIKYELLMLRKLKKLKIST